jgi:hypothetical protein
MCGNDQLFSSLTGTHQQSKRNPEAKPSRDQLKPIRHV